MKGLLFSSITPSFIYMTGYKEVTEVCTTPFIYLDGSMYEVLIRSLKDNNKFFRLLAEGKTFVKAGT